MAKYTRHINKDLAVSQEAIDLVDRLDACRDSFETNCRRPVEEFAEVVAGDEPHPSAAVRAVQRLVRRTVGGRSEVAKQMARNGQVARRYGILINLGQTPENNTEFVASSVPTPQLVAMVRPVGGRLSEIIAPDTYDKLAPCPGFAVQLFEVGQAGRLLLRRDPEVDITPPSELKSTHTLPSEQQVLSAENQLDSTRQATGEIMQVLLTAAADPALNPDMAPRVQAHYNIQPNPSA